MNMSKCWRVAIRLNLFCCRDLLGFSFFQIESFILNEFTAINFNESKNRQNLLKFIYFWIILDRREAIFRILN